MTMGSGTVIIKKGREKPIIQQHPWIFSGAIERLEGNPTPGDIVTVKSHNGRFLGAGILESQVADSGANSDMAGRAD